MHTLTLTKKKTKQKQNLTLAVDKPHTIYLSPIQVQFTRREYFIFVVLYIELRKGFLMFVLIYDHKS